MADTRDLKSLAKYLAYGFESRLRHFRATLPIFVAPYLDLGGLPKVYQFWYAFAVSYYE